MIEDSSTAKNKLIVQINDYFLEHCENINVKGSDESVGLNKFTVTNPSLLQTKKGSFYMYTVTGVDNEGDFCELRKYKEFL